MQVQVLAVWGLLAGLAVGMLLLDILRNMVKPQDMSLRDASLWTAAWGVLAGLFAVTVFHFSGASKGMEFLTDYVIEWSLSVGNVFVFYMIFQYFVVPPAGQQRVLFLGILGALVLRCVFIYDEAVMLASFSWQIYIFWAFLIWVGVKLLKHEGLHAGLRRNLRFCTHLVTVDTHYDGEKFYVERNGETVSTPLLPVLVLVMAANVMFAVDAISASMVISEDLFIVYASNLLAILGLRALYYFVAGILGMFRYMQAGLCVILIYIGVRMLISDFIQVPIGVSLGVVTVVLSVAIGASLLFPPGKKGGRFTFTPNDLPGAAKNDSGVAWHKS